MPVKGISCSKIALQDVVGSYCGRDSVLTEADIAASRNAPMEGADVRGYNMFMLGVNRYFAITSLLFFLFCRSLPTIHWPAVGRHGLVPRDKFGRQTPHHCRVLLRHVLGFASVGVEVVKLRIGAVV